MKSQLALLAGLSVTPACYSYKHADPAETVAPATGSHIRVRLTQQGALALTQQIGPQAVTVEGDVVHTDAQSLRLAICAVEDAR